MFTISIRIYITERKVRHFILHNRKSKNVFFFRSMTIDSIGGDRTKYVFFFSLSYRYFLSCRVNGIIIFENPFPGTRNKNVIVTGSDLRNPSRGK